MDEHFCSGYEEDDAFVFLEATLELFLKEGVNLHRGWLIIIKAEFGEILSMVMGIITKEYIKNMNGFPLSCYSKI